MSQEQDERRYAELLAARNLWPAEVALLLWLAARLGRRVEFWRYKLNERELGWQMVATKEATVK